MRQERSVYQELKPRSLPFHRWYASAQTRERGIQFLLNEDAMEEFSRIVRKTASFIRRYEITPYSRDCDKVSKIAKRRLRRMGLRARYVQEHYRLRSGLKSSNPNFFHAFVMVCDKERRRDVLVDLQYKQFLERRSNGDVPDVMVAPIRDEVYPALMNHQIDRDWWQFYRNGIFTRLHDTSHTPFSFKEWWKAVRGKEDQE